MRVPPVGLSVSVADSLPAWPELGLPLPRFRPDLRPLGVDQSLVCAALVARREPSLDVALVLVLADAAALRFHFSLGVRLLG